VESVCATVPLFFDMSTTDRKALSSKIEINFFETGKPVYKAGQPGEHFYVVMRGAVEEYIQEVNTVTNDAIGSPGALYLSGQYFGEQSLVAGTTYPSTMTCVMPSLLLSINESTYRAVFTNRNKLAEVNIRLLGGNVELQDILAHPKGHDLISAFMNEEHSAENLNFWNAVDQFETMVTLILKQGSGEEFKVTPIPVIAHPVAAENKEDMVQNFVDPDESASVSRSVGGHPHHPMYVHKHAIGSSATQLAISDHLFHQKSNLDDTNVSAGGSINSPCEGWVKPVVIGPGTLNAVSYANILARQRGLLDFGTSIINKFILATAAECVNIPGKMRVATLEGFTVWSHMVQLLINKASNATQSHLDTSFATEEEDLLATAKELFTAPKREIYQLLKKDSYVRFKATKEFATFIDSMNPYSKQDTSVSRRYLGSSSRSNRNSSVSRITVRNST
jgi:CRP-like cAMP-binding protein